TADRPDADLGDGICDADLDTPGEQVTLRAAVQHTNATPGSDVIRLPAGTYALTIGGSGESAGATGDLDLTDDVSIYGAGPDVTIVNAKKAKDRAFDIHTAVVARIQGLAITGGRAPEEESGGGIRSANGLVAIEDCVISKCQASDDAGGFDMRGGTSTLTRVWLTGNKAGDDGGAIDQDNGTLTLVDCALTRNSAGSEGGGIENSAGTLSMTNCTISGNKGKANAGGISVEESGTLLMTNCTVAFNKAKRASGIATTDLVYGDGAVTSRNSIFARNGKGNADQPIGTAGGNLDDGTTLGFGIADLSGQDARLGKLAMNGGIGPTHAIPAESPAVGLAVLGYPPEDQRGVPRTAPVCAGAYELTVN
ncbi:MAG: right-handed parallel beta-helix repeat-containing protein, partial [Planctomycetes bacterium]|nr:right-handed parallel beta-helix repeat-containing protein [Planctomycetota bacterium]